MRSSQFARVTAFLNFYRNIINFSIPHAFHEIKKYDLPIVNIYNFCHPLHRQQGINSYTFLRECFLFLFLLILILYLHKKLINIIFNNIILKRIN